MMNITLYVIGELKESFYRQACFEFEKRLKRYCRLSIVQFVDESVPVKASEAQLEQIKDKEGNRLLGRVPSDTYLFALDIAGEKMDSVAFAEKLADLPIRGKSNIGFAIGGSLGLSDAVLSRADMRLSFSDMTFPHQLMRVILLEQIYRAYRIANGEPYHK